MKNRLKEEAEAAVEDIKKAGCAQRGRRVARERERKAESRENALGCYGCKSAYETYIKDLQEQIRAARARRYPVGFK